MLRKLSIIVPVFDEERTVEKLVFRLSAVPFPVEREIICVDDGSSDGSTPALERLAADGVIRFVRHVENRGKGAAIRTALAHATGDVVVIQDADLELCPEDLPSLLGPILSGQTKVCFGTRFAKEARRRFLWRPSYWANRILTAIHNVLNNTGLTDVATCYKMMTSEVISALDVTERGFAVEVEIAAQVAALGYGVTERPISYRPRSRAQGKKIRALDFFRYVATMLRCRFLADPRRTVLKRPLVQAA